MKHKPLEYINSEGFLLFCLHISFGQHHTIITA